MAIPQPAALSLSSPDSDNPATTSLKRTRNGAEGIKDIESDMELEAGYSDALDMSERPTKRICEHPASIAEPPSPENLSDADMALTQPGLPHEPRAPSPLNEPAVAQLVDGAGNMTGNLPEFPGPQMSQNLQQSEQFNGRMAQEPSAESIEDHQDEERVEFLRQVHLQEHLHSHSSASEDCACCESPNHLPDISQGPGAHDPTANDESSQANPSHIEHIKWTQDFLSLIQSATLDADKLDEATRERLRNPSPPRSDEELALYKESLDLYFLTSSAPESVYNGLRQHMEHYHNAEMLSLHSVRQLVAELTGISPVYDDMCINGCHAFTGPFSDQTECNSCGQSRYLASTENKKNKVPRQQACTIPLGPQIQALRQSKEGSMAMQYRSQKMQELIDAEASGAEIVFDDVYCGSDLRNLSNSVGFSPTEDDTFVGISVDGAQLYQDKKSDTWFGIWIVYDYDPATRYKRRHILPAFIIPGPEKPKNVESYLFRSFYHLSALQRENGGAGLRAYDAMKQAIISSRIFFLFGTADAIGLVELDGRVGHHGAHGCRLGCPMKGRHKPGAGHYYAAHLRPNFSSVGDCDHPDFDLRHTPDPTVEKYQADLKLVIESSTQAAYERARLASGISRPSLISALKYSLPPPKCFTVDLMHLLLNNIPELMLSIWRGNMKCEVETDSKLSWDWATLTGKPWEEHGQLVAEAKEAFPTSFHRTPRNPAQKLNSGFKATEYCLYFYGLGPAYFRKLLPAVYWQNYCKLVRGARILFQRRITQAQMLEAYSLLVQFVEEFENIYYERRMDRLHFCRPALHTLVHSPKEVFRTGPGAYTTQFTLEGTIGLLTRDIRQHSTPFANVTHVAIRRSQWNAIQAMYPEFAQDRSDTPKRYSLNIGEGYELRAPRSDHAVAISSAHQAQLLLEKTGLRIVRKWGRIKLSNGQVIRSRYQEDQETKLNRRVSRMIKSYLQNFDSSPTEPESNISFPMNAPGSDDNGYNVNKSTRADVGAWLAKCNGLAVSGTLPQHAIPMSDGYKIDVESQLSEDPRYMADTQAAVYGSPSADCSFNSSRTLVATATTTSTVQKSNGPKRIRSPEIGSGSSEGLFKKSRSAVDVALEQLEQCIADTDEEISKAIERRQKLKMSTSHGYTRGAPLYLTDYGHSTRASSSGSAGDGSIYDDEHDYTPQSSYPGSPRLGGSYRLNNFTNPQYRELWEENIRLKAENTALQAKYENERANALQFRNLLDTALKQEPSNQASRNTSGSSTPTPDPSLLASSPSILSGAQQLQAEIDKKPPLGRDPDPSEPDFIRCQFWLQDDWKNLKEDSANNNLARPSKWDFITDITGHAVSDKICESIFSKLWSIWDHLVYIFMDPETWGVKAPIVTLYVSVVMYEAFPFLRYCDRNWKLHEIATQKFNEWSRSRNSKPRCPMLAKQYGVALPVAGSSSQSVRRKRGGDTSASRKKARLEPAQPTQPTSSTGQTAAPGSAVTPSTGQPTTSGSTLNATQSAVPGSTTNPAQPTVPGSTPGSVQPAVPDSTSNPAQPAAPGSTSNPRPAVPSLTTNSAQQNAETTSPTKTQPRPPANTHVSPAHQQIQQSGSAESNPGDFELAKDTDFQWSYSRSASPALPPDGTNPANSHDIHIPPPAQSTAVIQGPSQPPPPKKKVGTGKPEQPSESVTGRNLCLIDYVALHGEGITKAEFSYFYNHELSLVVRKEYETLAKQRKKLKEQSERLQPSGILEKNHLAPAASGCGAASENAAASG
ncbi:hypothetical protein EST38_g3961 [Candolleomyces aberdarensis]|uniref:Transposase n=1 Tax=Candolleomyces aberdarensis TaxID=2316362 RepID=A0A4Q2DP24_9AGAR|nr:hypothetical protein EST38_g3961 [Candolleomyces aberdarensis]